MNIKRYFIASEQNEYRPWITSGYALACFCIAIWSLKIILPASFVLAESSIDAGDLMRLVNAERTSRFIPALITNGKLNTAAAIKSNDMINRSYFAHINPDGNYVWGTIIAAGYTPYTRLGENLAMDFTSADAVVNAWMNSPTHRANIVNEKFEDQGMAAIYGLFKPGHNSILITNLFGTLVKSTSASTPAPKTAASTTTNPPLKNAPAEESSPSAQPDQNAKQETTQPEVGVTNPEAFPVSEESQFNKILQIILGIFAGIYMIFLVIDSYIIHKARLQRNNIHSSPQALLFLLLAAVSLFVKW